MSKIASKYKCDNVCTTDNVSNKHSLFDRFTEMDNALFPCNNFFLITVAYKSTTVTLILIDNISKCYFTNLFQMSVFSTAYNMIKLLYYLLGNNCVMDKI